MSTIVVNVDPRDEAQKIAAGIREELGRRRVLAVNFISSPGSGKTTILEKILPRLSRELRLAVIEADAATRNDADRLEALGIHVVPICTGITSCHISQAAAKKAFDALPLGELDLVVIENVGNLVCPAEEDLGEDFKIAVLSVAEGEDKPLKYPLLFQCAGLALLNKIDAAEALGADVELMGKNVRAANPHLETMRVSARTGQGLDQLLAWIKTRVREKQSL